VVLQCNLQWAKVEYYDLGFKVQMGNRYMGGFIGEDEYQDQWIEVKVSNWELCIQQLSSITGAYPHSVYAGIQKLVQAKWIFVQWVVRDIGNKFSGIQDTM
jgi:hypothetical protein